ncbi:hypothetical protein BH11MYX4_BH11MYX4_57360 [soil metagenome]
MAPHAAKLPSLDRAWHRAAVSHARLLERFLIDAPLPLALLRIVVPLVVLISPELYSARALVESPGRLAFVPEGLGLIARLPIGPALARVLFVIALSSAATAILGWWSRASLLVLTLSAGLLFSLSQRQGAVLHDMHLFWMTALLAASPCGDALSLDAWGKPRPLPSLRYGVPLFFARLLLGLVYLFPGLHKLRVSGLSWMTADNVIHQMHAKWLEHGRLPILRVDHAPLLCAAGAVLVIAFELSFLGLALFSRRTRWVALGAGLAFHLSTQLFLFIPFVSLWACYVVLVSPRAEAVDRDARAERLPIVVGTLLAVAVLVQGVRGQTDAWPVACYPTFAHVHGPTIPDLLVEVTLEDGTTRRLTGREERARSQNDWGRAFRLSGAYGDVPAERPLRIYAQEVVLGSRITPDSIERTRIYRVAMPTAPEAWQEPPAGGVLLREITGPP